MKIKIPLKIPNFNSMQGEQGTALETTKTLAMPCTMKEILTGFKDNMEKLQ